MTDPVVEAMLAFGESMQPLAEFLDGQREDLLRRGYSSVVAQRMVADLHFHVLWLIRGQVVEGV